MPLTHANRFWFLPVVVQCICILLALTTASAQRDGSLATGNYRSPERSTFKNVWQDQKAIWTSPKSLRTKKALWIVPWFGIGAGLIASDREIMAQSPSDPNTIKRAKNLSDAGLYGLAAASGILWGTGVIRDNSHARETGWLAGEAVLDGLVVNSILQKVTRRERPDAPSNSFQWWKSGSAFPSNHSMASWAAATVIANEYPGTITKLLTYGTAGAVTVSRVIGQKHSPSDAFIGASLGYFIGRQVYRSHHKPSLPGESIGTFEAEARPGMPSVVGSAYVELDSDIYPLLDRLIAANYVDSAFLGVRPWTRAECSRLIAEAGERIDPSRDPINGALVELLRREFAREEAQRGGRETAPSVSIDSLYSRYVGISGTPLRDSYHFGQTLYNDYGRPYWKGSNAIAGFAATANQGRFVFHVRGEYQHSPAMPGYGADVDSVRQSLDFGSAIPSGAPAADQFRLLEAYAGVQVSKVAITVGKQDIWWGPGESGSLIYSNNAEPVYMFRMAQSSPIMLPWVLKWLGPMRWDAYFGSMPGHRFPRNPFQQGQKISFKPTRNLEFGFSRTVVFAGEGHPLTFGSVWRAFSSTDSATQVPGAKNDVGDRRGGFDFSYRLPKLRDWVMVYGEFMTDDDPSPLSAPSRSILMPGIYFSKLPFLPKLDLRAEAPTSNRPATGAGFFYTNGAYHDGYTVKGQIVGDWIGRDATGLLVSSTYWFSPNKTVTVSYRNSRIDERFLASGGTLNDYKTEFRFPLKSDLVIRGSVQAERWNIPVLASTPQLNVSTAVELRYSPKLRW